MYFECTWYSGVKVRLVVTSRVWWFRRLIVSVLFLSCVCLEYFGTGMLGLKVRHFGHL